MGRRKLLIYSILYYYPLYKKSEINILQFYKIIEFGCKFSSDLAI